MTRSTYFKLLHSDDTNPLVCPTQQAVLQDPWQYLIWEFAKVLLGAYCQQGFSSGVSGPENVIFSSICLQRSRVEIACLARRRKVRILIVHFRVESKYLKHQLCIMISFALWVWPTYS